MLNMNLKAIITIVLCVFLTTACSKQLMPPEIETSGNVSNDSDFKDASSENNSGTEGGMAGGFFSEEPIAENSSSSFGGSGSNAFGQSSGGNSSSDSLASKPQDLHVLVHQVLVHQVLVHQVLTYQVLGLQVIKWRG